MVRLLETPCSRSYRRARRVGRAQRPRDSHEVTLLASPVKTAGRSILLLLACVLAVGCGRAQRVKPPDLELMRSSVESWHQYIRWGDYRGAQKYIAPERRFEWLKGVLES